MKMQGTSLGSFKTLNRFKSDSVKNIISKAKKATAEEKVDSKKRDRVDSEMGEDDDMKEEVSLNEEAFSLFESIGFNYNEYFYLQRFCFSLSEFDSTFDGDELISLLTESGDSNYYYNESKIMKLGLKMIERDMLSVREKSESVDDEKLWSKEERERGLMTIFKEGHFSLSPLCMKLVLNKSLVDFANSKTNVYLKYIDGDKSKGYKDNWRHSKNSFIYDYQMRVCKDLIQKHNANKAVSEDDMCLDFTASPHWNMPDDGTLDNKTVELYELFNFLTCKEAYVKQSISQTRKDSISFVTKDIQNMAFNRAESIASSVSPRSTKEDEEDVPYNHLYQDVAKHNLTQIQLLINTKGLDLSSLLATPKASTGASFFFSSKKKDKGDDEWSDVESDFAFITLSYTDNIKLGLSPAKVNGHTVSQDHHLTCEDCPYILSGNTIETHVSELPINFINDNKIWHRMATSARVKIEDSSSFPCSLLLHCPPTIQGNYTFRFELCVKIGKGALLKYAFCDFTLDILKAIIARDTFSFEMLSCKNSEEMKGILELQRVDIENKDSEITFYYHFMNQIYNVLDVKGDRLLAKEVCRENAFTWQVPYLFLLMRANDYHSLLMETEDHEDKEILEEIIMKYHEQIKLLEGNWFGLDNKKLHMGPMAFKPSTEKNIIGLEAVPLNLHHYSIEVSKNKSEATKVEIHDIITMGCPSVHALKTKAGGIRRQLGARLTARMKVSLTPARVSRPVSLRSSNSKSSNTTLFSSSDKGKGRAKLERKDSSNRAFQANSLRLPSDFNNATSNSSTLIILPLLSDDKDEDEDRDAYAGKETHASSSMSEDVNVASAVLFSGYLEKKGNVLTGSKKRFFMLTTESLIYYKSPSETTPLGVINLENILIVRQQEDAGTLISCSFDVVTSGKLYSLTAESKDEMLLWVEMLSDALFRYKANRRSSLTSASSKGANRKSLDMSSLSVIPNEMVDLNLYKELDEEEWKRLVDEARWLQENVSIAGWMSKWNSKANKWKKHFFYLHSSILRYFKSEIATCSLGIIDMRVIEALDYDQARNVLTLSNKHHAFIFQPILQGEINGFKWLSDLRMAAINLKVVRSMSDFHDSLATIHEASDPKLSVLSITSHKPSDEPRGKEITKDNKDIDIDAEKKGKIVWYIQHSQYESVIPDEAIFNDPQMRELRYRLDMATSQILTAVIASFQQMLETVLHRGDMEKLVRVYKIGYVAQLESLLSTSFNECIMLEDTDAAVKEMRNVRIKIKSSDKDVKEKDNLEIKRVGHIVLVVILVSSKVFAQLPLIAREDHTIAIIPLFFSIGINEMQWISNTIGDTSLQDYINKENVAVIAEYVDYLVEYFNECMNSHSSNVKRSSQKLAGDINVTKIDEDDKSRKRVGGVWRDEERETLKLEKEKVLSLLSTLQKLIVEDSKSNFEILNVAGKLVREIGGGRITCCKSGKDRTGLSCTLEMARLLRDVYGVGVEGDEKHKDYIRCLRMMRIYGVRLAVARKNIGSPTFAFNHLQRKILPVEYRPPMATCSNAVKA